LLLIGVEISYISVDSLQYYDIRKECEGELCYDFSNLEKFFGNKEVREALGVGNIEFVSCSTIVYQAMLTDWMRNLEVGIPALLEDGINVLIYAGEYDLICNWLGMDKKFYKYFEVLHLLSLHDSVVC
jgi:carboxypeptidase C (cathepsin A)